jgi:hypothetical protein
MSATNRWAMFDGARLRIRQRRIATRWGNLIDVTLEPDADVDTVCAWVIDADSVRVSVAATGYDETITLTGDGGRDQMATRWGGPPAAGHVRGRRVLGRRSDPDPDHQDRRRRGVRRTAEPWPRHRRRRHARAGHVGIKDYSVIQTDDFGTFQINKRAWHRRGSFQVRVADEAESIPAWIC